MKFLSTLLALPLAAAFAPASFGGVQRAAPPSKTAANVFMNRKYR